MSIIKHSTRTARKGCKRCGSKDVYWAHDTAIGTDPCGDCGITGKWVLIDADDMTRRVDPGATVPEDRIHNLSCPATRRADQAAAETEQPAPAMPAETEETPAVPETPATAPAPAGGAFAAFQALMDEMSPKVDRAEVEAIVKQAIEDVVFPTRTVIERASGDRVEVEGGHAMLGDVVAMLLADLHVMMVGSAGTGKSTLAHQAADALGLPFYSLSLSAQTPNSMILGYMDASGNYVRSLFREAYENGGVFLFDEVDNSNPNALAVVNAALANGSMGFPDGMVSRHPDFRVTASANTYGRGADRQYVGRQAMDAATLDRFAVVTVNVDENLETELCKATGLDGSRVLTVLEHVRRLRKSAEDQAMRVIVSPRASVGMCKMLNAGLSWDTANEAMVLKGMSSADRIKLGA